MKPKLHTTNGVAPTTPASSAPIEEKPGRVSAEVIEARVARHARVTGMLFFEESIGVVDRHERRKRLHDLVTLLLSRAICSGIDHVTPAQLCEELEQLRAKYVPAARIGG